MSCGFSGLRDPGRVPCVQLQGGLLRCGLCCCVQMRRCAVGGRNIIVVEQGFVEIEGFQVFNSCSLPLKE